MSTKSDVVRSCKLSGPLLSERNQGDRLFSDSSSESRAATRWALARHIPGEPLENAYRVLSNAGPSLETWPGFAQSSGEGTRPIPAPSRAQALYQALDLAARVWKTQGNDITELALALILPRPGHRATFRSHRPSHVLDYGSLRARALAAGGRLLGPADELA